MSRKYFSFEIFSTPIRCRMHFRFRFRFLIFLCGRQVEDYHLPRMIRELTGQEFIPIGDGAIALRDTVLSSETCEELFTPAAPRKHILCTCACGGVCFRVAIAT